MDRLDKRSLRFSGSKTTESTVTTPLWSCSLAEMMVATKGCKFRSGVRKVCWNRQETLRRRLRAPDVADSVMSLTVIFNEQLACTPASFLQLHLTHMFFLLNRLAPHSLPTCPATNCRGLDGAFPFFIPKALLLRRPETLCATITAREFEILVIKLR